MAHGTQMCYAPAIRRAKEAFGDRRMKDIPPLDIRRFIAQLERQGYSAQTGKVQLVVIRLICSYAVLYGDLDINPCAEVKLSGGLPKKKRTGATDEQIKLIEKAYPEEFGLFAYFLMLSGLRRGEALALCYEDIDRDAMQIHVRKKMIWMNNKAVGQGFTKTAADMRDVPLPTALADKLANRKKGLIFPGKTGLMTETEFRYRWSKYCRDAGLVDTSVIDDPKKKDENGKPLPKIITTPNLTPHQLRHTYATILYDAEVDAKAASKVLGHSKEEITRDVYTDISNRRAKNTADKINAFLGAK